MKKDCETCLRHDRNHHAADCLECIKANEKISNGLEALSKIAKRLGTLKVDNNGKMYNSLGDMYEPYKIIEKELTENEIKAKAFDEINNVIDMMILICDNYEIINKICQIINKTLERLEK